MEKYELLYILPAKYTESEAKVLTDKIGGIVTAAGGTIGATHDLGKRKLAYPIKSLRNGHFILVYFEAETSVIAKLNETFRLSTDLLRHLVVKRDPLLTKIPSLAEVEEGRQERTEERRPQPPASRPLPPPPVKEAPITMEELDKKLDEILTEEVL